IRAAEQAEANQAYHEAADLYDRLLAHVGDNLTRARLLCKAGRAHLRAGDPGRAQRFLDQGIPLLEAAGEEIEAAEYRILLGRSNWEKAQPVVARAHYEQARAVLERAGPSDALATAYIRLSGLHMFNYEFDECLAMAYRAAEVAEAAGAESARIWAGGFIGGAIGELGDPGQGLKVMGPVELNIEIQDLVLQLKMAARLSFDAGDMVGALPHAMTIQARPDWGMLFENRELGDTAVEVLIAAG